MKLMPIFKLAKTKGDRLWWVRCSSEGKSDANFKLIIPFGMSICTGLEPEWKGITIVKFYLFSICIGFGYKI